MIHVFLGLGLFSEPTGYVCFRESNLPFIFASPKRPLDATRRPALPPVKISSFRAQEVLRDGGNQDGSWVEALWVSCPYEEELIFLIEKTY